MKSRRSAIPDIRLLDRANHHRSTVVYVGIASTSIIIFSSLPVSDVQLLAEPGQARELVPGGLDKWSIYLEMGAGTPGERGRVGWWEALINSTGEIKIEKVRSKGPPPLRTVLFDGTLQPHATRAVFDAFAATVNHFDISKKHPRSMDGWEITIEVFVDQQRRIRLLKKELQRPKDFSPELGRALEALNKHIPGKERLPIESE